MLFRHNNETRNAYAQPIAGISMQVIKIEGTD